MTKVIAMNYTPFANLTVEELVLHVCNKKEPSDEEIELLNRIELLQDEIEDMKNRVAELEAMEPEDADA